MMKSLFLCDVRKRARLSRIIARGNLLWKSGAIIILVARKDRLEVGAEQTSVCQPIQKGPNSLPVEPKTVHRRFCLRYVKVVPGNPFVEEEEEEEEELEAGRDRFGIQQGGSIRDMERGGSLSRSLTDEWLSKSMSKRGIVSRECNQGADAPMRKCSLSLLSPQERNDEVREQEVKHSGQDESSLLRLVALHLPGCYTRDACQLVSLLP